MEFKDWLKNNQYNVFSDKENKMVGAIDVRALGEWAIEEIFNIKLFWHNRDGEHKLNAYSGGKFHLLNKIAVACLGEKEVKKRLEGL